MQLNISKKTKIVCTIGPASDNVEILTKLINNGMNVARLNFSHGDYKEHLAKLEAVRSFQKEGIYIPVMLDTKGPEIRTHDMENNKVELKKGQTLRISMKEVLGNSEKISVTFPKLYDDLKVNDHIKIDDGKLDLLVIEKDAKKKELVTKVLNDFELSSKKGVNCVGSRLSMKFLTDKDIADLKWGCEHDIDFIAASFVRNKNDIEDIRKILVENGHPEIKIISKIENYEAMDCLDEIIEASDAIMVARGDLGVEVPFEEVPLVQRKLISKCRNKGKPVITATQMLDSMTHSPIPTRAEVSDVATAVNESTDCVMLSAESASGEYPAEAVLAQAKISQAMEKELNYEALALEAYDTSNKDNNDAIANSIANTAKLIGAKLIVSYTVTGRSSRRISKSRPCCPILSISNNKKAVLQNGLYWGIYSVYIPTKIPDFIEDMETIAIFYAKKLAGLKPGDIIVVSGGTPAASGKTNFMRIISIPEDRGL